MFSLNNKDFYRIEPLIKSQNELSAISVIKGIMPGEIYVNNLEHPTTALIKTCECNLIAGNPNNTDFNSEVSTELDFWDQLTPDSSEWMEIIPTIHKNHFVRKYKRRHYILTNRTFKECDTPLKDGFVLEKVDLDVLRENDYENSEKLLEWAANWGDDESFQKYGAGYYIHNNKVIVSWSFSDCCFDKKVAIGIHTDERYRGNGFGKIVVSATAKECFTKGYESIDWLCVDTNKGSIAIAEGLGFQYSNHYYSFSTYPPIENIKDLTEAEWYEWGEYLENASKTEDCLIWDSLYSYIKSNDVSKTIQLMNLMEDKNITLDYVGFKNYITYLQGYDLCSDFNSQTWVDFINTKFPAEDSI